MRYDIFHMGMHFLVIQPAFLRGTDHRLCHGMRKMLFQAGRGSEQFIFIPFAEGNYHFQGRPGFCQRSGFIKYNGLGLRDGLQVFAAFYGDPVGSCFPDGG